MWILFAFGSALFAGLTAVLAKIGVSHTNSALATAIRAVVILLFSWMIVVLTGGELELPALSFKTWLFLILSGLATGASWLCYFRALKDGVVSVVVPIDKLSIVVAVALSYLILGETLTRRSFSGLFLIVLGTMGMIFF